MRQKFCALAAGVAMLGLLGACDTIRVNNSFSQVGLLVDGASSNGPVNDRRRTRDATGAVEINVGGLSSAAAPDRNEAVAFGLNKPPRRAEMRWTSGRDRLDMVLGDPIGVGLTIWIVQGPFAAQRDHAFIACLQTLSIWYWERTGLTLNRCDIHDATADPDVTNAILNSTGGDNRNWNDFSNAIGFAANQINVYWINTVEGSTTTGWSDFGGRIVMGRNTGQELLVHEVGHGFSLRHPVGSCSDASTMFDHTNIMWACSDDREFATEGQVFRMHFNPTSSLNALYNARPGQPTEDCVGATETPPCPAVERRLWADGAFPKN
jgi:hypothetical protein